MESLVHWYAIGEAEKGAIAEGSSFSHISAPNPLQQRNDTIPDNIGSKPTTTTHRALQERDIPPLGLEQPSPILHRVPSLVSDGPNPLNALQVVLRQPANAPKKRQHWFHT